jgi:hypothetical protein
MPELLPVPGVVKVEFYGTMTGATKWANVFHYRYSGTLPSAAGLAALANTYDGVFATYFAPLQSNDTQFGGCRITDLSSDTGAYADIPDPTDGTRGAGLIPAQLAVLVSYQSVTRFRGGHPRSYFVAGIDSDLLNPSTWTDTFPGLVVAAATEVQGAIIGSGADGTTIGNPCWVRYGPKSDRLDPPQIFDIVPATFTALARVATQRRRTGRKISRR